MSENSKNPLDLNTHSGEEDSGKDSSGIQKAVPVHLSEHDTESAGSGSSEPVFPSLHKNQDEQKESEPKFPSLHADHSNEKSEHENLEHTTTIMAIHDEPVKQDTHSASDQKNKPEQSAEPHKKPAKKTEPQPETKKEVHMPRREENNTTRVYAPLRETPEETLANEKDRKKKQKKQKRFQIITSVLVVLVAIEMIICAAGIVIVGQMVSSAPTLDVSDFVSEESSRIYDDSGNVITEIGTYYRENITYDQCPESLVDAFLSVEDSRFFTHFGFDIPRFTKAIIENLKSGDFSQGGSTFTMQLVKNTYFTVDDGDSSVERTKSIEYKVQQIYLSIELEQVLDKKEIFQLYMNKLNFGGRIRGVQKASKYYFGKDCSELTLTESALLAGIVNLPNGYNPYYHLDAATSRRDTVLDMMEYHGYITSDECSLAKTVKVEDELVGENYGDSTETSTDNKYQSYIDAVLDEAESLTGQDPTIKGMQIYTYMNTTVQDQVESIQDGTSSVNFPNDLMQTAMISMDNTNGAIVAIGGGRNYNTGARLLNRATSQYKQPGSSVKPVLSYALGFEYLGYSMDEILVDKPITYPNESMVLVNATGTYAGDVTIKDAVAYSLNIPAITTLEKVEDKVGKEVIVNYMQSIGFSKVTSDNFHLSFAIGGTWFETTVEELAGAHAMIINGGVYNEPHTIQKVVMTDGTEYYPQNQNKQVLSSGSAYLSTELMYNNVYGDVLNYMQLLKRDYPVYAKTGTSDWGSDGLQYGIPQGAMKDKWMVASTSKYTNAVWVGYDYAIAGKNTYMTHTDAVNNYTGQICKLLLDSEESVTDLSELQGVTKPSDVEEVTYVNGTYPHVKQEDGMDSSVLITSEVSKTGLESQPLVSSEEYKEYLSSDANSSSFGISAEYDSTGALSVTWSDGSSNCVNGQKNISLNDQWGNNVEAWGACLVDLSWLTGDSTSYWGKVYVDDTYIGDISSSTGYYYGYPGSLYGTVKVCGGTDSGDLNACVVAGYSDYVTDQSGSSDSTSTGHYDESGNWVDDGWWDESGTFHHN
ncbi:MAG: transglycosylase domain-containing protein [Solobacterium sp.]|jgi:penicillin-binding protein 1A|nr:transglycosylase domain-containing protein [Solobacterium sp.]MCH4222207.1 transglycosylase domain-containing protein [Solobacterium sp.]MCH4266204.1 transglycosylase domain-containing protein [Solobacterium sp.]